MANLVPVPGLVVPYSYLWRHEHVMGEESGRKIRPSVVVAAVERPTKGAFVVAVVPITTRELDADRIVIEIPRHVQVHLRFGTARSWVICDESNEFVWPGVDLATTPRGDFIFGYVPDALIERVRRCLLQARARGDLKRTPRTG